MASISPSPKETTPTRPPRQSWWKRISLRLKIILGVLLLVIIIGLAVGLGVGLTIGQNGGSSGGGGSEEPSPTSTFSPLPSPTIRPLWTPNVNESWQIILLNNIELDDDATSVTPNVSVYDIDLFTNPKSTIDTLHRLGKRVICYFSAGSYEPGRPDSANFTDADMGDELQGWPGEKWLDLNSTNVRNIMVERIKLASEKGCDAVDPDNVDGYQNKNGLNLTPYDSINFLTFLSNVTLSYNLSMGLKNAGDIIPAVLPITYFSVNEQCVEDDECETFSAFINASKPVFHIEYPDGIPNLKTSVVQHNCDGQGDSAGSAGFSTVLKNMSLDGWVEYCDGSTATTPMNNTGT